MSQLRRAPSTPPKPAPQSGLDRVARAIDALRAGRPVRLIGASGQRGVHTIYAAETIAAATLKRLKRPLLILSHARARTLKIRLYTPQLLLYAAALEKIFSLPVTLRALHFLAAGRTEQI